MAGGTTVTAVPHVAKVDTAIASPDTRGRRHSKRRPSGGPPPLPRAINASVKWWLAFALSAVGLWITVVLTRRTGVTLDAIDHALLDQAEAGEGTTTSCWELPEPQSTGARIEPRRA